MAKIINLPIMQVRASLRPYFDSVASAVVVVALSTFAVLFFSYQIPAAKAMMAVASIVMMIVLAVSRVRDQSFGCEGVVVVGVVVFFAMVGSFVLREAGRPGRGPFRVSSIPSACCWLVPGDRPPCLFLVLI